MKRGFLNGDKAKARPLYSFPTRNVENTDEVPFEQKLKACNYISSKDPMLITTVPTVPVGKLPDPGGHSQWIVKDSTKKRCFKSPEFPLAVPKAANPLAYAVHATKDMGLGVFATRDIKVGEVILVERPLLVMPGNLAHFARESMLADNSDTKIALNPIFSEVEEALEAAVARMSVQNQVAFKALANSHTEDGSGPLLGIVHTNGYMVDFYDEPHAQLSLGIENAYTGICNVGSRINHSCMPNTFYKVSLDSFSFQFWASRDIDAGEQIFSSYCNLEMSAAQRKAALAHYGFDCSCSACVHATPETDKLREEFSKHVEALFVESQMWTSPGVDESALEPLLKFQNAVIKEGLNVTKEYVMLLLVLAQLYIRLGRHESAMECLAKAKEIYNQFT